MSGEWPPRKGIALGRRGLRSCTIILPGAATACATSGTHGAAVERCFLSTRYELEPEMVRPQRGDLRHLGRIDGASRARASRMPDSYGEEIS